MHDLDDNGIVGFKADLTYVRDMKCYIDIHTFFHLAKGRSKVKRNKKKTGCQQAKPSLFNI